MARKTLKAKEPVRIRFKELADGNKSIYLDIYSNGKRRYDFLRLYLVPERTAADRLQNTQTMRAANAIKAQRVLQLANDTAGIDTPKGENLLFVDWLANYPRTQAQSSKACRTNDKALAGVLQAFPTGATARLTDIDKEFCRRFIRFLLHEYTNPKNGHKLAVISAYIYYTRFVCALNTAVRHGLIKRNPCSDLSAAEKIHTPDAQRCYLTREELQQFAAVPVAAATAAATKQAFLFSCFCGLRISDIERLTWGDITESGGRLRIEIRMQKTRDMLYIPLSKQAQGYLPERGAAGESDRVFALQGRGAISQHVHSIAEAAGITKNVTFHTARHTFATLLLTQGADIYTTSKLLGHADISTTQIYAKIVDAKKQEAVQLLDNVLN